MRELLREFEEFCPGGDSASGVALYEVIDLLRVLGVAAAGEGGAALAEEAVERMARPRGLSEGDPIAFRDAVALYESLGGVVRMGTGPRGGVRRSEGDGDAHATNDMAGEDGDAGATGEAGEAGEAGEDGTPYWWPEVDDEEGGDKKGATSSLADRLASDRNSQYLHRDRDGRVTRRHRREPAAGAGGRAQAGKTGGSGNGRQAPRLAYSQAPPSTEAPPFADDLASLHRLNANGSGYGQASRASQAPQASQASDALSQASQASQASSREASGRGADRPQDARSSSNRRVRDEESRGPQGRRSASSNLGRRGKKAAPLFGLTVEATDDVAAAFDELCVRVKPSSSQGVVPGGHLQDEQREAGRSGDGSVDLLAVAGRDLGELLSRAGLGCEGGLRRCEVVPALVSERDLEAFVARRELSWDKPSLSLIECLRAFAQFNDMLDARVEASAYAASLEGRRPPRPRPAQAGGLQEGGELDEDAAYLFSEDPREQAREDRAARESRRVPRRRSPGRGGKGKKQQGKQGKQAGKGRALPRYLRGVESKVKGLVRSRMEHVRQERQARKTAVNDVLGRGEYNGEYNDYDGAAVDAGGGGGWGGVGGLVGERRPPSQGRSTGRKVASKAGGAGGTQASASVPIQIADAILEGGLMSQFMTAQDQEEDRAVAAAAAEEGRRRDASFRDPAVQSLRRGGGVSGVSEELGGSVGLYGGRGGGGERRPAHTYEGWVGDFSTQAKVAAVSRGDAMRRLGLSPSSGVGGVGVHGDPIVNMDADLVGAAEREAADEAAADDARNGFLRGGRQGETKEGRYQDDVVGGNGGFGEFGTDWDTNEEGVDEAYGEGGGGGGDTNYGVVGGISAPIVDMAAERKMEEMFRGEEGEVGGGFGGDYGSAYGY